MKETDKFFKGQFYCLFGLHCNGLNNQVKNYHLLFTSRG